MAERSWIEGGANVPTWVVVLAVSGLMSLLLLVAGACQAAQPPRTPGMTQVTPTTYGPPAP